MTLYSYTEPAGIERGSQRTLSRSKMSWRNSPYSSNQWQTSLKGNRACSVTDPY
jgi:hypothetical protein